MLWQKASIRKIAKTLGRDASTISREIKRNQTEKRNYYRPRLAHEKAVERRSSREPRKLDSNEELRRYVTKYLKLGWSPEQIAIKSKELEEK
jgi:IS30 family transposase